MQYMYDNTTDSRHSTLFLTLNSNRLEIVLLVKLVIVYVLYDTVWEKVPERKTCVL
jgi:hypothetical protein